MIVHLLNCTEMALSVGLTCCFLLQRLTDDGAAQKLPPSGLNSETTPGDALPSDMLLSSSCFTLNAPSKTNCNIFLCFSHLLYARVLSDLCCSPLPLV